MNVDTLRLGAVYEGKTGKRRRLLEIGEPGKVAVSGSTWARHGVRYECLDGAGGHRVGETPTCSLQAFARWATRCLSDDLI